MAGLARQVLASAARSSSGASSAIDLARRGGTKIALTVHVTAVGGDNDETLDLSVEWSHDGINFAAAEPADSFNQILQTAGAPQRVAKAFDIKAPQYRIVWTLGGTTPSFTFAVDELVI